MLFKKILLGALVLASAVAAQAQSVRGRSLGATVGKQMAYFTQESTLVGGTAIQARVGPLTSSSDGFGITKAVVTLPVSPVGALPTITVPNPVTQDIALKAAVTWTQDYMPQMQQKMGAWLKKQGLSAAVYNYSQEIMVSTVAGPVKRSIAFAANIDDAGRPTYGAPKIVDPDPTIVDAVYISLAPAAGLPATFQFPDAGYIKWRMLNRKYEVISDWQKINVYGVYDKPESAADDDIGLKCLVDARDGTGCNPSYPTMRSIIDSVGATWGLLAYVRQLEPMYGPDGTPVSAITVDRRETDCATYTNKGAYGFVVTMQSDQYVLEPKTDNTVYTQIASYAAKGLSPTQSYTKTLAIPALGGANPDLYILNPDPTVTQLWSRSDATVMSKVIYVAPLITTNNTVGLPFVGGNAPIADYGTVGDDHSYTFGTIGDNYWGGGQYDQAVYFNLPSATSLEKLTLTGAHYDDYLLVSINGVVVFNGPYGGDTLALGGYQYSEAFCEDGGGRWNCYQPSSNQVDATQQCTGGGEDYACGYYCPAGYMQVYGAYSPMGVPQCAPKVFKTSYPSCIPPDGEYSSSFMCSTSPCNGYLPVQYSTGGACGPYELKQSFYNAPNINMLPYVKAGVNEIFFRTVVGGNGEGFIDVTARNCGSNLPTSAPNGPGAGGVTDTLTPLAQ